MNAIIKTQVTKALIAFRLIAEPYLEKSVYHMIFQIILIMLCTMITQMEKIEQLKLNHIIIQFIDQII